MAAGKRMVNVNGKVLSIRNIFTPPADDTAKRGSPILCERATCVEFDGFPHEVSLGIHALVSPAYQGFFPLYFDEVGLLVVLPPPPVFPDSPLY